MDDYISREYLLAEYDRQHQGPPGGARKIIAEAPAADVVEVVRCRDCRFSEPYGLDLKCDKHSGSTKNKLGEELGFIEWHTPHFFCSDGKRKDGGQDDGV
jgi:hypothetical protein